uniref:ZP domain-containing protein n=1 Tax=Anopheles melas TaxID=34690 RepID=A0A182UCB0_9DIPT
TVAEDQVEVVKSVSPGDEAAKRDNDSDQVALESVDQDLQGSAPVQSAYPQHLPAPLGHGPGALGGPGLAKHGPLPHHGPPIPHGPSRGKCHLRHPSLGLGQPFGPPPPPPPQALPVAHAYHGPPPPPPPPGMLKAQASELSPEKLYGPPLAGNELWSSPLQDMPKIVSLDVKCEKQGMKVFVQFDKPFFGIVFSKGHYSNVNCVHLPAGLGKTSASFDIGIHECGTAGNTDNVLYNGYSGTDTNAGSYFENIIVLQYDPQVQEVWDQARKLRCTWHDQYEKSVTFRPFPVDMLDVIRADFAGDNVGCWMQIQVGKG